MRIIDSTGFGEIRAAFLAKRHQAVRGALKSAQFSLGGLLEAAAWLSDASHGDQDGRSILEDSTPEGFKSLVQVLSHGAILSVDFARNGVACARSIGRLDSGDRAWTEYLMGFHAALVQNVYDKSYARALAQSLHEMADNVRQHAGASTDTSPTGLAGWHVANGIAAFAVVDVGRGVKDSLRTNRHWSHLQSDRDALLAVVCERATRNAGNRFGDGYSTVVQNFVSRNGCLALRSGDAELVATGTIIEGAIRTIACPRLPGTRVAARCAPSHRDIPPEPSI